jgi:tetratricopeptide (TPR) repeat protein
MYEVIQKGINDNDSVKLILDFDPNLLWTYGILLTLATAGLYFWNEKNQKITGYLNAVAFFLIVFPLFDLVSHKLLTPKSILFAPTPSDRTAIPDNFNYVGPKPDIYYIILDGYLRQDVMNEFFRFDNSKFIKSLENRGFYIAPKSRSNYQSTWFSLASSLNMEYFSENFSVDSSQSINNIPLLEAVAQNKVAKLLKSIGYQYIHLPSFHANGAITKSHNNQADIIITSKEYISQFSRYILNKTFLKIFKLLSLNEFQTKRREVLYGFKKLENIPHNEEPTFTYAHFLMPHAPHAFNSKGELPAKNSSESEKYFDEILFANKKINHLVDYLQQNSKTPPIIIIQGDHGYFAYQGSTYRPDVKMIKRGYSNLSAYYLPDIKNEKLYAKITPVNSFRLIFDSFFQTKFGMLKDKSYYITNFTSVRKLIPVPSEDSFNKSGLEAWVHTLEETILNRPDFERAHTMLGIYYKELQLFPEAKVALKKAIHLNPNLAWPYIVLSEVYFDEGKYPRALQEIKHAIDIDEKMPAALTLRGKIEMSTGNYNEAISSFKQAMKVDQIDLDTYMSLLSSTYALLKNKEKTLLYAKKAIKISPTFANYNNLGTAYALFGLNKEAKSNWIKSLKISPRNPVAYRNLGKNFLKTKDYEEAIKFYQKVIKQKPDYLQAFFNLGTIYATLNKNIQAVEYYQKTLALDPNHMLAHYQLGNVLLISNQSESALLEYKQAVKLNPDHIPSFVNLGHTFMKLGRVDKARKTYEAILLRQPNISVVHKNLGFIYYQIKENPGKAIYHFQEYLRLSPNQSDASQIKSMIQLLNNSN